MATIEIDQVIVPGGLNIEDLTKVDLKGDGVWDKMLQQMKLLLNEQFEKGRITGPAYAEAFHQLYDTTLQSAISFLLSKERQALEIIGLGLQNQLVQAQIKQVEAQVLNTEADTKLKEYQFQFLYPAQLEQANKQLELMDAQISVQLKQLDLLQQQVEQAEAQADYYRQKVITEKAQTDRTVIGDGSVIDTQVDLMNAQKDGYQRNAEQQAAQIITNTWNVRRQTDEDTQANSLNLLNDETVGKTVQKLLNGIAVPVTPS